MARSRNIGGVYAELSLRDSKFQKGIKSARAGLNKFGSAAIKGAGVAGVALAAGLAAGSKRAITMGADLDHLSTQTGVSVAALMKLGQAYKDNGKDASGVGKDIGKMQKAIYDAAQAPGTTIDYFADMGVSAEKLMAMSPEEQFFAIGDALKAIENPTKQAALALGIFGRSGAQLMTVFKGSNLDDVNASLGKMPEIMDRFSWGLERADTLMGRLPNKSDQFFTGFTAGVIGEMIPALESVNGFDFTEMGERLGDTLAAGIEGLTNGYLWEAFALRGTAAAIDIGEALKTALSNASGSLQRDLGNMDWVQSLTDWRIDKFGTEKQKQQREEWRESGSPKSDFKMKEVGKSDLAESLREDAALLEKQMAKMAKFKKDAVEAAGAGMEDMMTPKATGGSTTDLPEWLKRDPYAKYGAETPGPNWEETSANVNSMQSRGLGMGSMLVPKEIKEQVSLLTQIRDVLKTTTNSGDPAFG